MKKIYYVWDEASGYNNRAFSTLKSAIEFCLKLTRYFSEDFFEDYSEKETIDNLIKDKNFLSGICSIEELEIDDYSEELKGE